MARELLLTIAAMLLTIILGVFLMISPGSTLVMILRILGVFFAVFGLVECIAYFTKEERTFGMHIRVVEAAALLVFGVVLLVNPEIFVELYPIYMGIVLILFGWSFFLRVWDLRKNGLASWLKYAGLALVAVALGILVVVDPFENIPLLVRITGGALVYNGIIGIWLVVVQHKLLKEAGRREELQENREH